MSEKLLMVTLLVTGLIMFAGFVYQLVTGYRFGHGSRSEGMRRSHRIVGYGLLVVAFAHVPLGVLDAIEALLE